MSWRGRPQTLEALTMRNRRTSFNPCSFADMLVEGVYAKDEKRQKLKVERQKLVVWLRQKDKKSPRCLRLADKLENCSKRRRCQSLACPECGDAAQRLLAKVTQRFLKKQAREGTTVCITVVPADGTAKSGRLSPGDHDRAVRRWRDRLAKAGIMWFVGATDFSFNEQTQGRFKPHWSVHFYGMTVTKAPKKLKRSLKALFPKAKSIPRPVEIKEWDGNIKALRYILKPNFWRRIATDDAQRHNKKTGGTRKCRDTDRQPLRSRQKRELLVFLDNLGMQARLIMRSCQVVNRKTKGPTIELRVPKGGRVHGTEGDD
jgi:hypothetical protein